MVANLVGWYAVVHDVSESLRTNEPRCSSWVNQEAMTFLALDSVVDGVLVGALKKHRKAEDLLWCLACSGFFRGLSRCS